MWLCLVEFRNTRLSVGVGTYLFRCLSVAASSVYGILTYTATAATEDNDA